MSVKLVPLDAHLSAKMRKKFDDQEKFNAAMKIAVNTLFSDVIILEKRIIQMQQTITRLCKEAAEKEQNQKSS